VTTGRKEEYGEQREEEKEENLNLYSSSFHRSDLTSFGDRSRASWMRNWAAASMQVFLPAFEVREQR